MNFRDQWAEDEDGHRFVFTVEMQRALAKQGLPVEPASLSQLEQQQKPVKAADDGDKDRGADQSPPERAAETWEAPATVQIDPETGKYLGRLKWFNPSRGYGFIVRGGSEDIFFHRSDVLVDPETLEEGQWVLYDVEESEKGLEANEVEPYAGDLA